MGEVSSGLLHLHQQISAPDPYKLKLWSFFVQTVIKKLATELVIPSLGKLISKILEIKKFF